MFYRIVGAVLIHLALQGQELSLEIVTMKAFHEKLFENVYNLKFATFPTLERLTTLKNKESIACNIPESWKHREGNERFKDGV